MRLKKDQNILIKIISYAVVHIIIIKYSYLNSKKPVFNMLIYYKI